MINALRVVSFDDCLSTSPHKNAIGYILGLAEENPQRPNPLPGYFHTKPPMGSRVVDSTCPYRIQRDTKPHESPSSVINQCKFTFKVPLDTAVETNG